MPAEAKPAIAARKYLPERHACFARAKMICLRGFAVNTYLYLK
jgi:hypothetical protein